MKEKLCLRQVTPSECVETKNVGLFLLYQKWAVKREPRWSCLRSCLKGLKGCLKRLTSAGGKKNGGGTIRYLEIEEGDIVTSMISNKKLQKRVS